MAYLNVSDRSVIIFTLSNCLYLDNNYFCFTDVIFICVLHHWCYDYSSSHTVLYVCAHMYTCVCLGIYRYIIKLNFLPGQIFLRLFQFILSNETASSSRHVDSKSNSFTEAVTCCCTLLYWKMDALVWSTSFYWAATLFDERYMWEKNIPNHQMFW